MKTRKASILREAKTCSKTRIILLTVVLVFSMQVTPALAARSLLSVPEYSQQPYQNLCWATCASMVISFFKGDSVDRKVEIAKDKYGQNFNQPATLEDTKYYITRYTSRAGSFQNNALSYTAVQYQINNRGPIVSRVLLAGGGHQMVIKGYDTSYSSVIYNDPWDGLGHSASYSYYVRNERWTWDRSLFYY